MGSVIVVVVCLSAALSIGALVLGIMSFSDIVDIKARIPGPTSQEKPFKRSKPVPKSTKKKPIYHDDEDLWMRERAEKRRQASVDL